jgi:hypothetical protein
MGDLAMVIQLLTTYPIPLNSRDGRGCSLLEMAIAGGNADAIDYLLGHEEDLLNLPSRAGRTGLHFAISTNPSLLRHIISHHSAKIDWGFRDLEGLSYLHHCYFHRLPAGLAELFEQNCDESDPGAFPPVLLRQPKDRLHAARNHANSRLLALKPDAS